MKKFFSFVLVLAVVCSSQLLLSGVVLAQGHYEIDGSSTVSNNYEEYSDEKGGVFYVKNTGDLTIESSTFVNNKSTGYEDGGAIYNEGKTTITDGVTFSSNSAGGNGGAIYNTNGSTMTITAENVAFTNNIAVSRGGAIYNENSTLNLVSKEKMEFTGNKANGVSNAIHDNKGIINLFADENAQIIFNDRITSQDNTSILNINSSTDTITANGKIVLNEDMSGYTGKVNIYGGEVELQANPDGDNINLNKFFSGDINFSSGTLNLLNGAIDNITVSTWSSTANSNLKFDVDLSSNTSDNFTVTNSATGQLNLTAINILGVKESSGMITLFNNGKSPNLNVLTVAYYGGYEYSFSTQTVKAGELEYKVTGSSKTFKEVINDTVPVTRSYSLAKEEKVVADLGQLGGTQLTIFGNGYDVDGNSHSGIMVSSGQVLNIEQGTGETFVWKNFSSQGNGGVLNSTGTINISGSIEFRSNSANNGGAIYNWYGATMTISGTDIIFSSNSAKYGGAIYSYYGSTMTISGTNITFSSNRASSNGGAINNYNGSTMTISGTDIIFSSNSAGNDGGAIYNNDGSTMTIDGENVEFKYNTATSNGGAIYNYSSTMTIKSTGTITFNSNRAVGYGGAIYNYNSGSSSEMGIYGENIAFIDNVSQIRAGGAITNVVPLSCCASKAPIYVFPNPTTSDRKTPPYSFIFSFASKTASL